MRLPAIRIHHFIGAGLLGVLLVASLLMPGALKDEGGQQTPTVRSTGPAGLAGLRATCEGLGMDIGVHTGPVEELDLLDVPALIVAGPPLDRDLLPVLRWVEEGGTLLLAGEEGILSGSLGLATRHLPEIGGTVTFSGKAADWGIPGPVPRTQRAYDSIPEGAEILATVVTRGETLPLIVAFPRGEGRVIALADAMVLGNFSHRGDPGAVLGVRLVEEAADGGPLLFGETWHLTEAEGSPGRALRRLLARTPFGHAALGAMAFLLLGLLAGLPRFGRVRRDLEPPRRSEYEYLDALGGLFAASRAWQRVGGLLLLGARRRLTPGESSERAPMGAREIAQRLSWDRPAQAETIGNAVRAVATSPDPEVIVAGLAVLDLVLPPARAAAGRRPSPAPSPPPTSPPKETP